MSPLCEYLSQFAEPLPAWLARLTPDSVVRTEDFLRERVVFYPGSGLNGQPVRLFGQAHAAHCFLYVDYGITESKLKEELDSPGSRFRGYRTLKRQNLTQQELAPKGWHAHVSSMDRRGDPYAFVKGPPFAFLEILEREPAYDDEHGPARLAVLFMGADGIATFDALFCQPHSVNKPWAILLQDHGFGGNYDSFGGNGLMERIANQCHVYPEWLLVAENTTPWQGYLHEAGTQADIGGVHNTARRLYSRQTGQSSR